MDQEKKKTANPQVSAVLRAVVGAYLLYLAWGLREAAFSGEGIVYLLFMIVFALAGAALLFFSVRQLYREGLLFPGQSPEEPNEEGEEEDDEENGI